MKKQLLVAAGLSVFSLGAAGAQGLSQSACPPGSANALGVPDSQRAAQDACQQAYDLYQYMAPQLGVALAGGNATLGTGSTLGGLGHFSIGIRANVFNGSVPQVDQFTQSGTGVSAAKTLPTKDQYLGLPTADAAIGIFQGIPLGLTNVGGVDVLVSATYVPTVNSGTVSVTPNSNMQFGYGVRVGILQESIVVPGVSVTYLKRDLPTTSIKGTNNSGSTSLSVNNLKVNTTAWRLVASKNFLVFGLAAGYGRDTYDQSADIAATYSGTYSGTAVSGSTSVPGTAQSLDRDNMFADVSLNLPLFKIVGEIGQSSGGTVNTYNSFASGRADKSYQYFSAGIRLAY
jgi:hypothetical protein